MEFPDWVQVKKTLQVKIFAEVLEFLTRVYLENVWDSGEGENRVDSGRIQ